jgi:hypothetical protein
MPLDRRSLLAISRAKRKLAAAHAADMAALEKYFRDEVGAAPNREDIRARSR